MPVFGVAEWRHVTRQGHAGTHVPPQRSWKGAKRGPGEGSRLPLLAAQSLAQTGPEAPPPPHTHTWPGRGCQAWQRTPFLGTLGGGGAGGAGLAPGLPTSPLATTFCQLCHPTHFQPDSFQGLPNTLAWKRALSCPPWVGLPRDPPRVVPDPECNLYTAVTLMPHSAPISTDPVAFRPAAESSCSDLPESLASSGGHSFPGATPPRLGTCVQGGGTHRPCGPAWPRRRCLW